MFNLIRAALRWTRANPDRTVTICGVSVIYTRPDLGTCGWVLYDTKNGNRATGSTEADAHRWLSDALEVALSP
jgi:hypothetical protein